ncbi:hypothetical protein ACTOVN_02955 [Arcanobacterium canis]
MKIVAYVLVLLGLFPGAGSTFALDVPPAADIAHWFENDGLRESERQAPSVFGVAADSPTIITVGAPKRSFRFSGSGSNAQVVQTNNWVAPVSKNGAVVGAIEANFDDRRPKAITVSADVRLGSAAGSPQTRLVADSELDAWFSLGDQEISPASKTGAELVLGEIPLKEFLANRGALAGEKRQHLTSGSPTDESKDGHSLLAMITVGWGVGLLVVFSLLWLRWDLNHREKLEKLPQAVLPPEPEPAHDKPSFKDAAPKVAVYQLPRTNENVEKENNDNPDD